MEIEFHNEILKFKNLKVGDCFTFISCRDRHVYVKIKDAEIRGQTLNAFCLNESRLCYFTETSEIQIRPHVKLVVCQ